MGVTHQQTSDWGFPYMGDPQMDGLQRINPPLGTGTGHRTSLFWCHEAMGYAAMPGYSSPIFHMLVLHLRKWLSSSYIKSLQVE